MLCSFNVQSLAFHWRTVRKPILGSPAHTEISSLPLSACSILTINVTVELERCCTRKRLMPVVLGLSPVDMFVRVTFCIHFLFVPVVVCSL